MITEEVEVKYTRFKDAPWFETIRNQEVLLCGAGGIGSWTALALVSAGCENLMVCDYDTLEEHNLGGQFYTSEQAKKGEFKTHALLENIKSFCDTTIGIWTDKIEEDTGIDYNHVICGFDNMKARKVVFERWCEHIVNTTFEKQCEYANDDIKSFDKKRCIFIDGRLTAEQIQIFTILGDDEAAKEEYRTNHLFDDALIADAPCTFKQTRYLAMKIAGLISEIYTNYLSNISSEVYGYKRVPFFYETYTPLMSVTKTNIASGTYIV